MTVTRGEPRPSCTLTPFDPLVERQEPRSLPETRPWFPFDILMGLRSLLSLLGDLQAPSETVSMCMGSKSHRSTIGMPITTVELLFSFLSHGLSWMETDSRGQGPPITKKCRSVPCPFGRA